MSVKILETSPGTYSRNDTGITGSGGGFASVAEWARLGGTTDLDAITDDSDATYWYRAKPNLGDPSQSAYGSMNLQEDLTAQIPWNSAITSVAVAYRTQLSSAVSGFSFRPYIRTLGASPQPTTYGTTQSLSGTTATDYSSSFAVDSESAAWTLTSIYNDLMIGMLGNFPTGSGSPTARLLKLWAEVTFTLPAPTLTGGSATPTASSAQMAVTANANHTFDTAGTDGYPVTVSVEWGLTTAYGNTQEMSSSVIGDSNTALSTTILGLSTGITYHYRFKAVDGDNTVYTTDATFTTTSGEPVLVSY